MKENSLLARIWLLPIYLLFIYTWFLTGFRKLFSGGVPEAFTKRFEETFLATFPGIPAAYYQIAGLEIVAGILFLLSLLKLEFLPGKPKTLFYWGIWFSVLTFTVLGFGLRLVGENDGSANIFFYIGATIVLVSAVQIQERLSTKGT
jgi:hypothetical protein